MDSELITKAVLACVALGPGHQSDRDTVAALTAVRASLATIFGVVAQGIANSPKYSEWSADQENPGYLVTRLSNTDVRVPWNLIADFPDRATLEELLPRVEMIKTSGDSVMCVSGSVLIRSLSGSIGDIDLCEYLSAAVGFDRVVQQAVSHNGHELACLRVTAHVASVNAQPRSLAIARPWSSAATNAFLAESVNAALGKCDFAFVSRIDGGVEMTKMVLRVDPRYPDTEGPWDLSFPFQEAPLNGGAWVPRRLAAPKMIGRYVVWLFNQVEGYATSLPLKSAKRALALARILGSRDLATIALQIFRDEELATRGALQARLELLRRIRELNDPVLEYFRVELERTILALAGRVGLDVAFTAGAARLSDELLAALDDQLKARSSSIESLETLILGFRSLLAPAVRIGRY